LRRPVVYAPYADARYVLLAVALAVVFGVLVLNLVTTAFTRIGFSWFEAVLLLSISLIGSGINVPLFRVRSEVPVTQMGLVRHGPFVYRVPYRLTQRQETLVAVNVGGALVPVLVSTYLLLRFDTALPLAFATTLIVAAVVYRLAEPVKDLGVVIRGFWPPLTTALTVTLLALLFSPDQETRFVAAYVGGTLGTLIGADLLNLGAISRLGAGIGSIGGAGTFDGVFLAGVVAVLLA
jgi:uncharacterized membrane protein